MAFVDFKNTRNMMDGKKSFTVILSSNMARDSIIRPQQLGKASQLNDAFY